MPNVLVTTSHRGVFHGELESYDADKKTAIIKNVRCCIRWRGMKGFIDLAVSGPGDRCRVTPAVPKMTIEFVTSITECTEKSQANWDSEPWGD